MKTLFVAAIMLACLVGVVDAAPVSFHVNDTTGGILFADTFEGDALGANPVADTGTWRFPVGGYEPKVTSAAAEGGFAAYQGSQYLTFVRADANPDRAMARDATTSGAGQKTTVQFAFRNVSGFGLQVQAKKDDGSQHGGNNMGVAVYLDGPGSVTPNHVRWYDGSAKDTGLVSDPSKWNTLVWSHTDGAAGYTVSLNGSAPVAITEAKAVIWDLTYMSSLGLGTTYIDAFPFPEPSSLVLLGAMPGLLAYAWRKRKLAR